MFAAFAATGQHSALVGAPLGKIRCDRDLAAASSARPWPSTSRSSAPGASYSSSRAPWARARRRNRRASSAPTTRCARTWSSPGAPGTPSHFSEYLGDDEASCGLVKCGYLISAAEDDKLEPLRASLKQQEAQGVRLEYLDRASHRALLPIASFDDAALIGYEPDAGFADAYMVATSSRRARAAGARRCREGVTVNRAAHGRLARGGRVEVRGRLRRDDRGEHAEHLDAGARDG